MDFNKSIKSVDTDEEDSPEKKNAPKVLEKRNSQSMTFQDKKLQEAKEIHQSMTPLEFNQDLAPKADPLLKLDELKNSLQNKIEKELEKKEKQLDKAMPIKKTEKRESVGLEARIEQELMGEEPNSGTEKVQDKKLPTSRKVGLEAGVEQELKAEESQIKPKQGLEARISKELEKERKKDQTNRFDGYETRIAKELEQEDQKGQYSGLQGYEARIAQDLIQQGNQSGSSSIQGYEAKIAQELAQHEISTNSPSKKDGYEDRIEEQYMQENKLTNSGQFQGYDQQIMQQLKREMNHDNNQRSSNGRLGPNQGQQAHVANTPSPAKKKLDGIEAQIAQQFNHFPEQSSNPSNHVGLEAMINNQDIPDGMSIRTNSTINSKKSLRGLRMDMFFEKRHQSEKGEEQKDTLGKKFVVVMFVILFLGLFWMYRYRKNHWREIPKDFNPLPIGGDHLHVFQVPHTHDNVGWLMTPEQYYNSTSSFLDRPPEIVKKILDSVIDAMLKNKHSKFSYAEMAYFKMWWSQQDEKKKEDVRELIRQGRLEILGSGVTTNDEATPYFEDMLDNKFNGIKFAKKELDTIPKVGWQLDSFGHSSTEALLNSRLGYNAMVFSRIAEKDKADRVENNDLKTLWRPNNLKQDEILAEITNSGYCEPEFLNKKGHMDDMHRVNDFNVDHYSDKFYKYLVDNGSNQKNNHLLQLLGCDFSWYKGGNKFENFDRIVRYINNNKDTYQNISLYYSTPSEYYTYLSRKNTTYSVKMDDFFPYNDNENSYWSGYFTSRPYEKLYVKELGRLYQKFKSFASRLYLGNSELIAGKVNVKNDEILIDNDFDNVSYNQDGTKVYKEIDSFKKLDDDDKIIYKQYLNNTLSQFGWEIGLAQGYNTISGTSRSNVQEDYFARMKDISTKAYKALQHSFKYHLERSSLPDIGDAWFEICHLTRPYEVYCPTENITDAKSSVMSVYNPGAERDFIVRIKVPGPDVQIIDEKNEPVKHELLEYFYNRLSYKYQAVFKTKIAFKSYKFFMIRKHTDRKQDINKESPYVEGNFWSFFQELPKSWTASNSDSSYSYHQNIGNDNSHMATPTRKIEISIVSKEVCNPNDKDYLECLKSGPKGGNGYNETIKIKVFKPYQSYVEDYSLYINVEKYDKPPRKQASGPYVFNTDYTVGDRIPYVTQFHSLTNFETKYYNEVIIKGEQADVILRIPKTEDFLIKPNPNIEQTENNEFIFEIETMLQPNQPLEHINEEIVLKIYNNKIDNRETFFTDSNGQFMQQRTLKYFYDKSATKSIPKNYYPISSAIYIEDWYESQSGKESGTRMTVMNDRAQGGSSLRQGEIELMLTRVTTKDDAKGNMVALRETIDPLGIEHKEGLQNVLVHRVIVDKKSSELNLQRRVQFWDDLKPIVMVGNYKGSEFAKESRGGYNSKYIVIIFLAKIFRKTDMSDMTQQKGNSVGFAHVQAVINTLLLIIEMIVDH